MAENSKKDIFPQDKKNKSGFASLKKKLNIPKIYKRLASKLSVHGRHIRALTSSWSASELQCLVSQYELLEKLKELSDAAESARSSSQSVSDDLLALQNDSYLCDLTLSCHSKTSSTSSSACMMKVQVHSSLFLKRLSMIIPPDDRTMVQRWSSGFPLSSTLKNSSNASKSILDFGLQDFLKGQLCDIKFEYEQERKIVTITADHCIPRDFLHRILYFVYGKNLPTLESSSSPSHPRTTSTNGALGTAREEIANQTKTSDWQANNSIKSPNYGAGNRRFMEEFRSDMKDLLLSANMSGDVKLLFAMSSITSAFTNPSRTRQTTFCFHCHSFVLAARSKFFRSIIQRHAERRKNDSDSSPFMIIELDRKVLSYRYFPVVIYAMYTDELDIQRIAKNVPIVTHRAAMDSFSADIKDLLELFYIGKFLEFPVLIQACENALLDHLNVTNFIEIMNWLSQGHGSSWMRRQVIRFAKENFQQLLAHGDLFILSSIDLAEIVSSDFVNASELDILRAVLKWAEHELMRKIELREPNLVRIHIHPNQTTRNIRVSSARRLEFLLDRYKEELHNITASLLPYVRLRHVLPTNHEVLNSAINHGIISCPPDHLLDFHHHGGNDDTRHSSSHWISSQAGPEFAPPRFFAPYFIEVKAILKERIDQEAAESALSKSTRRVTQPSSSSFPSFANSVVPDALYMVKQTRMVSHQRSVRSSVCEKCEQLRVGITSMATKRLKYINNCYPVPTPFVANSLLTRERTLRQSVWIRKILQDCHGSPASIPHCRCNTQRHSFSQTGVKVQNNSLCTLCLAESYIRLIVVREHDLPDVTVDILKRPHVYYDADELLSQSTSDLIKTEVEISCLKNIKNDSSSSASPMRLHRRQKSRSTPKRQSPQSETSQWNLPIPLHDSSSDLSLSDDSSSEWPFPYRSVQMRDRTQPGSLFWDSDSSIKTPPMRMTVPDVAASANSTLQSRRCSRLTSSSSSSDSCSSVPCRLIAESKPPIDEEDTCQWRFYSGVYHSFSTSRKAPAPSYAHYLSLRYPNTAKRRPTLSGVRDITIKPVNKTATIKLV